MRRIALLCLLLAQAGCIEIDWTGSVAKSLESACSAARNCQVERSGRDRARVP